MQRRQHDRVPSLTSTVTKGYICSAAMLAHGSAARSSTLSLWLRVTMMTGWPSSLGLRSIDSTSPLLARATVAVVQMAYRGFRDGLSTLTGVVGFALFMLLGRGLLLPLAADLPSGGVPALRSGELLPEPAAVPRLFASAWQGRIAARPHVTLHGITGRWQVAVSQNVQTRSKDLPHTVMRCCDKQQKTCRRD